MSYHFSKKIATRNFEEALELVSDALKTEGFGVLTTIDVKATFKKKLDVDFRNYHILGACNPNFAHKAISAEDKIGVFLPCSVVVQEHKNGQIEVSFVDPIASMMSVQNPQLGQLATEVQEKLKRVFDVLK